MRDWPGVVFQVELAPWHWRRPSIQRFRLFDGTLWHLRINVLFLAVLFTR